MYMYVSVEVQKAAMFWFSVHDTPLKQEKMKNQKNLIFKTYTFSPLVPMV